MEKRQLKATDQEECKKAFQLLMTLVQSHPDIESAIWTSALWNILMGGYIKSEIPYEQFKQECFNILKHYKKWFEDEKPS